MSIEEALGEGAVGVDAAVAEEGQQTWIRPGGAIMELKGEEARMIGAIEKGDLETVKQIVRVNPSLVASPFISGDQPLHYACWQEQVDIVRFLIGCGADVNSKGQGGRVPLHYAAYEGDESALLIARLLLQAGADPNASDDTGFRTLDYVTREGSPTLKPLNEYLLTHGAEMTVYAGAVLLDEKTFSDLLERKRDETPDEVLRLLEEFCAIPGDLTPPEERRRADEKFFPHRQGILRVIREELARREK